MKVYKSNTKLGQVINKEEISKWNGNVIFDCATASGKTYFVLNNLSEYCTEQNKRILFICNRSALLDEVNDEIAKQNVTNVDTTTYQQIESNIRYNKDFTLEYDYIALDEIQHFTEEYNVYTDLSYDYLINHPAKKIFMSATSKTLFRLLLNKGIVDESHYYKIEKDYSYVDEFIFYKKKNAYLDIIKDKIENTDDKIIFFTQSIEEAIELYKTYKDIASFYCSKHTKNQEAKLILAENEDCIHNNTFDGRLLVATKALDLGISLKDKMIKTIIVNMFDHNSMQQAIGRKRIIDNTDTCTIYIRDYYKRGVNVYRDKCIKDIQLFLTDREKFNHIKLSNREYRNPYIYFDVEINDFKVNKLAYLSILTKESELDEIMNSPFYSFENEDLAYRYFILKQLGLQIDDKRIMDYCKIEEDSHMDNLTMYLDSIVGKRLFKDEQKQLKEEFKKDGLKARTIGINTMNGNLQDRKLPYLIVNKRSSERIDGKVKTFTFWEVIGDIL